MRICIYGAGAIGGYLGAQLALAGEDVTLIARGPHLEAMQSNGLKLRMGGEERVARPRCTSDPAEAGEGLSPRRHGAQLIEDGVRRLVVVGWNLEGQRSAVSESRRT